MPGPMPKPAGLRQRRNAKSTRANLQPERAPIKRTPALPDNPAGTWSDLTRQWWADVWSSPMRNEFLRADLGALFRLAILVDMFWKTGDLATAREIRLVEREFGLTPLSRRRLEWTVADTEEKKDRQERKQAGRAAIIPGDDPRHILE